MTETSFCTRRMPSFFHIFNEDRVDASRVVYKNVGDGDDEIAVPVMDRRRLQGIGIGGDGCIYLWGKRMIF